MSGPREINQAAVVFSQLVKDFKSLNHTTEESIQLAEAMVRVFADCGPKIFALAEAVKRKGETPVTPPGHA